MEEYDPNAGAGGSWTTKGNMVVPGTWELPDAIVRAGQLIDILAADLLNLTRASVGITWGSRKR